MQKFEKDTYKLSNGKNLIIEFFFHASIKIDYDGTQIYIDPVSEYADYSLLNKADIILITHEHYDHFDASAVNNLLKEDTKIIANAATINLYGKGIAMGWGETLRYDDVVIKAFGAYNTTEGRDKFHPKNRDNGYLLTIDDFRIYISGDTEIIEDNEEINNCDILFLAVNQPYTMSIRQAKKFAQRINPKYFYPYHTTDTDMSLLSREFKAFKFQTIIHNMP